MKANSLSHRQATAEEFAGQLTANLDLLWRLGLYLTGHALRAGALVERIASQALEQRAVLRDSGQFKTWLLTLAVSTWKGEFTDARSGSSRYIAAATGDAYELTRSAGYAVEDDPAADLAGRINRDDVCRALLRIPPEDRAVTALSLAGDLSYGELGAILGLSRDAVRERLQRGRAALKVGLWGESEKGEVRSKK